MLIGAHVSVGGGYEKALDYAVEVGCECIQIFAKSPRQWNAQPINPLAAERFRSLRAERGFGPVFTHGAYLISLATSDPVHREKSIAALGDELLRGSALGAAGVVTHLGSDPDDDCAAAARRIGEAVNAAFELAGGDACNTRLLLENTSGAGHTFGSSFEQLADCIEASGLPSERLGVCLDTCHGFAFGMALDTADGWEQTLHTITNTCGIERLGLVHANDSMFERGSRRDRHAWIGQGFIGETGFSAMVHMAELRDTCACTEMPGQAPEKDIVNIARLKVLREAACNDGL
ncbi:MAG: deoxyribonuclease IV [Coriobacteriia bacterium]|nr:deoxyribonuclease IV [Coriobacteriia bacterium]